MTPDQLPDPLQLRNLVRSLATLDLLVAPNSSSITFAPASEPHTETASIPTPDASTSWTMLFTHQGATLTEGDTSVASTLDHPTWESSAPGVNLPDILTGTPEAAQEWLAIRYNVRPDLTPIRQILMSVPLTVNLVRELGNPRPWPELREAVTRIGYPIPDEDLPGPDNPNSGVSIG